MIERDQEQVSRILLVEDSLEENGRNHSPVRTVDVEQESFFNQKPWL